MALKFGIPYSDNLLCDNVVCQEKATTILHMKDKKELFYCAEHFPMDVVGKPHIDRVEKLRQPGERNTRPQPTKPEL